MRIWAAATIVGMCVAAVATLPDAPATDPVERALDALHASGARGEAVVEALVATGVDPTDWRGRDVLHEIRVPPPGDDPIDPLREAYAVLSAGANASAWPDPVRGDVDLSGQLADNVPAALASQNDAVHSWQLLAMAAAGMDRPGDADVDALRQRLLELQSPDGAWGCGPWHGPECTGFALAALHATGGIPADAGQAAADYILSRFEDGPFGDPLAGADAQVTAWAVQGLRLTGTAVPAGTLDWIVAQQQPGGMWRVGGRPSAWATAEVVVMLAGGHPVGRAAP